MVLIPKIQSVFAYHVTFCRKMKNKILQIMLFKGILNIVVTNCHCLLHLRIKRFYFSHTPFSLKSKTALIYNILQLFRAFDHIHHIHHLGTECWAYSVIVIVAY